MIHNTRGKRWVFSYKKRLWRYGYTEGLMCGLFTTVPSWRDNFQSKPHTHTHMACLSIAPRGTKKFPFWIYFWRIIDSPVPRSLLPQPKESSGSRGPFAGRHGWRNCASCSRPYEREYSYIPITPFSQAKPARFSNSPKEIIPTWRQLEKQLQSITVPLPGPLACLPQPLSSGSVIPSPAFQSARGAGEKRWGSGSRQIKGCPRKLEESSWSGITWTNSS